jgi:hypothetical protein
MVMHDEAKELLKEIACGIGYLERSCCCAEVLEEDRVLVEMEKKLLPVVVVFTVVKLFAVA